jgi:radical SAM protein with 4Fe4S-binding SPASM domain
MRKYVDPNLKRKSKILDDSLKFIKKDNIPLPSLVEISDSGTCNRTCSFCPRSDPKYEDKKEFIDKDLNLSLCKQLSEYNYAGIFAYSGFNEPLLNKNIYSNIKNVRKYLPKSRIEIVTNGDVLNKTRLIKLFDSGLSLIHISVYDSADDAKKFLKLCNSIGLTKDQFLIRHRYLGADQDFGLTLSNRSGLLENAEFKIKPLSESLQKPCFYPSYTFFMDYNGDVLMCSHDWGKKNILGNLNNSTFIEIWNSQLSKVSRKSLTTGDRNFSPCNVCDVQGNLIGESHSKAWNEYYKK